jgi:hypothetical protein
MARLGGRRANVYLHALCEGRIDIRAETCLEANLSPHKTHEVPVDVFHPFTGTSPTRFVWEYGILD